MNNEADTETQSRHFEKYFTLEEATALIPTILKLTTETQEELQEIRDSMMLYKRMIDVEEKPHSDHVGLLENKVRQYEAVFNHYIDTLAYKGVQVKDVEKGLVDFPYLAKDGTEYLLCWHMGEEGLFYFHELHTGYAGRTPITLLPE